MTNKKIILQNQQSLIPLKTEYKDKINLFITSPKGLLKGTILLITKSEIYLDFGTKPIIRVSKKLYIKNLIKIYIIYNNSYLLVNRSLESQNILKENVKNFVKIKLVEGQTIRLKINTINSIKNIYNIDFKRTIEYIKYNKFFFELERIKKYNNTIKGYIKGSLKGGYSVVIGGIYAFLPGGEFKKLNQKKLNNKYDNISMKFKISKLNISKKNIVLNIKK